MKKEKNTASAETPKQAESKPAQVKEKPAKVTKVGAMLKEMRQQKGLKVSDIAKALCVRKFYLEAIEESHYGDIPAFPYGIGFIRSYAKFLGLNDENIVELYKEETNISEPKDIHVLEPQSEANMPGIQYLLISLLAIAAVYAGWTFFNQDESASDDSAQIEQSVGEDSGVIIVEEFNFEPPADEFSGDMTNETATSPAVDEQISVSNENYVETPKEAEKPTPNTTKQPAPEASAAKEAAISAEGVVIEAVAETWVEVKNETKLYLSKVLMPGDTYKVPEGKGMILSFGKYDGAKVYINGVLTTVAKPSKKTNIALDKFLDADR